MDVSKMKIFVKAAIQYGNLGYLDLGVQELLSFYKECLIMAHYFEDISTEEQLNFPLGLLNEEIGCFEEALIYYEGFLKSAEKLEDRKIKLEALNRLGKTYMSLNKYREAIEYSIECLNTSIEIGSKEVERDATSILAWAYYNLDNYQDAVSYMEKSLNVAVEIGDKEGEADAYNKLLLFHLEMGQHHETIKYSKKSLELAVEVGNETGKRNAYLCLGETYQKLGNFNEAIEYFEQTLKIAKEMGDNAMMEKIYVRMSICYQSLGNYDETIKYSKKRLLIAQEIGEERGIAIAYTMLGEAYREKGDFEKAINFYEKYLNIGEAIREKEMEQKINFVLGDCYRELVIPDKAISYYEQSIKLSNEIGDKVIKGSPFMNLGLVYQIVGELDQAIGCHKKSLEIFEKIGDKEREGNSCVNLGVIYKMLGKYEEATMYHQKSLDISIKTDNKHGKGLAYLNLGCVSWASGKDLEAHEYFENAVKLFKELDCKNRLVEIYDILGCFYEGLGKYDEAIHYLEKSLDIAKEIGNEKKTNNAYTSLVTVYLKVGKFHEARNCLKNLNIDLIVNDKITALNVFHYFGIACLRLKEVEEAINYFENCLDIAKEIGKRESECVTYSHLGRCYQLINKFDEAIQCCEKSLEIAKELEDKRNEAPAYSIIGSVHHWLSISHEKKHDEEKCQDAKRQSIHFLKEALRCWDLVYDNLQDNDDFKISIVDTYIETYNELATVLIETDQIGEALLASDRGRARGLGDLLTSKYGIKPKTDAPGTTQLEIADVNKLLTNNSFCIINFAFHEDLVVWVLAPQKPPILVKCGNVDLNFETQEVLQSEICESNETRLKYSRVITAAYYKMKATESVKYENRSLEFLENNVAKVDCPNTERESLFVSSVERNRAPETQNDSQEDTNPFELEQLYTILISPLLNDIDREDIVIIPDGPLYRVPFAALRDPNTGLFLSEAKRIRLAPSLTTLMTLQECPTHYHCKKRALIVGASDVGEVIFQGKKITIPHLESAKQEAKILKEVLNAKALIGPEATKANVMSVLQKGVSIIHIAGHGITDNGHIALAPPPRSEGTSVPEERDYILTMHEVNEIGIRAQLVFLSCCHSGRGEIKAEGVVGMSRAFLAAGARAVVASLWAIDDDATLNFMVSFYTYLKQGETTSKSLQLAMKETREDGYVKQRHWAPFFLIGDDVTISV